MNVVFLLKLSTDKNIYQLDTRKFVTLLPDGKNKLKRKSYVDLRNVYKTDKNSARIIGYVPDHILRRLINKVNRIHNNDPKPYYEEYISSL